MSFSAVHSLVGSRGHLHGPRTGEGPGRPGGPPEVNRVGRGRGSESPEVALLPPEVRSTRVLLTPVPRLTCSLDLDLRRGAQGELDEGVWDEKVL